MITVIWIICFAVALILIALTAKILFDNKYGRLRYAFACIVLAVASIVLYAPYFFSRYNLLSALLSCIFNAMQVISLDADFYGVCEMTREQIDPVIFEDLYICLLAVIHISLPTLTIFTAYNIVAYCMSKARLIVKNLSNDDVFVFSSCTKKAEQLAQDIHKKHDKKSYFIFSGNPEQENMGQSVSDSLKCIFCEENIDKIKIKIKKKRNIYYFNISEDEDKNLNDALSLIEKYAGSDLQSNISIMTFLKNNENNILIDASNKGSINIRIIDEDQVAVYELLDKKPLYTAAKNNMASVLITGFDNGGEELLKAALWCGQLENISIKINIVTDNIERKKARLLFKYPEILCEDYNVNFYEANLDEVSLADILERHCMDTTYIAVTNDSDEDNIRLAIYLRRFFLRNDPEFKNMPFIAAKVKSIEKYESLRNIATPEFNESRKTGYDIYPYGNDGDIYSYGELVASPLEKLARNVHLVYEDIFNGGKEIDVPAALARYNVFEVKKRSNRANAMHIRYKLWALGLDYIDADDESGEEVELSDYLDGELLQKLTVAEHDRWMAFLRTEGWAGATVDESKKYRDLSKGRHECPIIQLHPYICAFDDLVQCSEALGLPDATVYDKELINRIPDILHDKWGAAGKRYKIILRAKGDL